MTKGGELSNLEYLPTKTENVEYLWNTQMHTSCLFSPMKLKQALDHKKQWKIEQHRVFTYQTKKCGEHGNVQVLSILAL
jgi:hypothetical protein